MLNLKGAKVLETNMQKTINGGKPRKPIYCKCAGDTEFTHAASVQACRDRCA